MDLGNHGNNIARLVYPEPNNLVDFYTRTVEKFPNNLFIGERDANDTFVWTTYGEFGKRVDNLRAGIASLGIIKPGDKIGIISKNRFEWAIGAFASFGLRACWVPMYEKELEFTWKYIIKDTAMKIVFVPTAEIYSKVESFQKEIPTLQKIFIIFGEGQNSMRYLEQIGQTKPIPPSIPRIDEDAVVIYTSGTTADPKGVVLTHGNVTSNSHAGANATGDAHEFNNRALNILPWAHTFAMTGELFSFVKDGKSIAISDVEHLGADFSRANPTHICCVPRVFNRVYQGVHQLMEKEGGSKLKLFLAAKKAAKRKRETGKAGFKYILLDKLVLSKIRARFGKCLRFALTGGGITDQNVANFFYDLGIPIYDCYGLTETTPAVTVNCPKSHRLGSVGQPLENVKVVIDKSMMPERSVDGEILVYGPNVMKEYLNKPEKTAAVMIKDENGIPGIRTGDLGRMDENNFLYLTGRIKNEYKLQNGKYVHPDAIEEYIQLLPWIANVMIYGDGKPFNVGLVYLDPLYLRGFANAQGIDKPYLELVKDPAIQEKMKDRITQHMKRKYLDYEIPKDLIFLEEDFTLENGMLTQSMKLKRRSVLDKYANQIETLYKH